MATEIDNAAARVVTEVAAILAVTLELPPNAAREAEAIACHLSRLQSAILEWAEQVNVDQIAILADSLQQPNKQVQPSRN